MTVDLERYPRNPEARPAVWMFATIAGRMLHHYRAGRGKSACGRYWRNAGFQEAGFWWAVLPTHLDADGCPTCQARLRATGAA